MTQTFDESVVSKFVSFSTSGRFLEMSSVLFAFGKGKMGESGSRENSPLFWIGVSSKKPFSLSIRNSSISYPYKKRFYFSVKSKLFGTKTKKLFVFANLSNLGFVIKSYKKPFTFSNPNLININRLF